MTQPTSEGICNHTRGCPNAPSPPSHAMRNLSTIFVSGTEVVIAMSLHNLYSIIYAESITLTQADSSANIK